MAINHWTVWGSFTRDPEIRRGNTTFARFTLACKDDYSKDTDFIECNAWGSKAEWIKRYFHKGDTIIVFGRGKTEKWTDKDGNQREKTILKVNDGWFPGAKPEDRKPQEHEEDEPTVAPITITDDDDPPF